MFNRSVNGVNFLTALVNVAGVRLPCAVEFVKKDKWVTDEKTGKQKRQTMERIAELSVSKIEQGVSMIARAIKKGFIPQYVLADSWFITDGFIKSALKLKRKKTALVHVIGLMKSNRKVQYNGKTYTADVLPRILESKIKASRKLECKYLAVRIIYKGTPLKSFFVMMNGQSSWKLLITTDDSLSFIKAIVCTD